MSGTLDYLEAIQRFGLPLDFNGDEINDGMEVRVVDNSKSRIYYPQWSGLGIVYSPTWIGLLRPGLKKGVHWAFHIEIPGIDDDVPGWMIYVKDIDENSDIEGYVNARDCVICR